MRLHIGKHHIVISFRPALLVFVYLNEAGLAATQVGPVIVEYWTKSSKNLGAGSR
jgi:hypothetical protein